MPLSRHIEQGRLLYFTRNPNAISVSENDHFRWLTFGDVIQSVMNKHAPYRLTLPHQYALLQPLRFLTPTGISELGLGGGNIVRFIHSLKLPIIHQVIEQDLDVIYCYQRFFRDTNPQINLQANNASTWLYQQERQQFSDNHWFIYDIYQHQDDEIPANNETLFLLLSKITNTQIVTVNLPFISRVALPILLTNIINSCPEHQLLCYQVPHYHNKIIHILPKHTNTSSTAKSGLTDKQQKYWQGYHQRYLLMLP